MEQDLVDLLVAEHRRIESLFAELETARTPAARRTALDLVFGALTAHARTEDTRLLPVMRTYLPAFLVEHETGEHRHIGALTARLARLEETDEAFAPLLAVLMETVREHVQEEETEVFPRLRDIAGESLRVTNRADG